jgi:hypothetical protein
MEVTGTKDGCLYYMRNGFDQESNPGPQEVTGACSDPLKCPGMNVKGPLVQGQNGRMPNLIHCLLAC